jgi:hypothetical protein
VAPDTEAFDTLAVLVHRGFFGGRTALSRTLDCPHH